MRIVKAFVFGAAAVAVFATVLAVFATAGCTIVPDMGLGAVSTTNLKLSLSVTAEPADKGSVTVTPSKDFYRRGDIVHISAAPAGGWYFDKWQGTVDAERAESTMDYTIAGDSSITAIFRVKPALQISVQPANAGSVAATPDGAQFLPGTSIQLQAQPAQDYYFDRWSGSLSGTQAGISFDIEHDTKAVAVFNTLPVLSGSVSPAGAGTVTVSPNTHTQALDSVASVSATAAPGYEFDHWELDVTGTNAVVTVRMNDSKTVRAVFRPFNTLGISVTASGGSVILDPPGGFYPSGTKVTVTAHANPGYDFYRWTGSANGYEQSATLTVNGDVSVTAEFVRREWTVLVYMAADNDLETQAINDINEMESVDLRGSGIKVIALVDRATGYDSSNGGWTDTRLLDIGYDSGGINSQIDQKTARLASTELGLSTSAATELDMGNPNVLKNFVRFAKTSYPAANYGLIVWGHGSGWRSGGTAYAASSGVRAAMNPGQTRAAGFDDGDSDFLYTSELGEGVAAIAESNAGTKWGFIGTDSCNGMTIESAYQLKDYATYYVGSEDLIPAAGWSYGALLGNFKALAVRSPVNVSQAIFNAFVGTYGSVAGSTCSVLDFGKLEALNSAWNAWSSALRGYVTNGNRRDVVRNTLFNDVEDFYETPGDLNIDMYDAADRTGAVLSSVSAVTSASDAVKTAVGDAILYNFAAASGNGRAKGIAVHLVKLSATGNIPDPPHDGAYVRGGTAAYPLSFVQSANSTWVPSLTGTTGLLDRLFYWVF